MAPVVTSFEVVAVISLFSEVGLGCLVLEEVVPHAHLDVAVVFVLLRLLAVLLRLLVAGSRRDSGMRLKVVETPFVEWIVDVRDVAVILTSLSHGEGVVPVDVNYHMSGEGLLILCGHHGGFGECEQVDVVGSMTVVLY